MRIPRPIKAIAAWLAAEALLIVLLGDQGSDGLLAAALYVPCIPLGYVVVRWRVAAVPYAVSWAALLIASALAGCGGDSCNPEDTLIGNVMLVGVLVIPGAVAAALGVAARKLVSRRRGPAGPLTPPASATSPG